MIGSEVFRFVYIPVDTSRPLEEWSESVEPGQEVECLLDRLKSHFLNAHPSISEQQRKKHREELIRQKGLQNSEQISEHMLDAATNMQLVESIALLPCMQRHDCVGVTMYVDDSGSFKQLPINVRATDIALNCGMISTQVLGDAFIGRVKENDEEFERRDFLISEVSSTAGWMKDARRHNKEKMNRPAAEDLLKELETKEQPQIIEITPAEEARQKGNDAYRKGSYPEAVKFYTLCLEHDPESAVAYSNRSMAQLQLQSFEVALSDANAALKLDEASVKAQYRRGLALEGLGRTDEAVQSFQSVMDRQPSNKAAAQKLNELQSRTS